MSNSLPDSIFNLVNAKSVAVVIEAQHMCMMMRGVEKQSSKTRTEYIVGSDKISETEQDRLWKQF